MQVHQQHGDLVTRPLQLRSISHEGFVRAADWSVDLAFAKKNPHFGVTAQASGSNVHLFVLCPQPCDDFFASTRREMEKPVARQTQYREWIQTRQHRQVLKPLQRMSSTKSAQRLEQQMGGHVFTTLAPDRGSVLRQSVADAR